MSNHTEKRNIVVVVPAYNEGTVLTQVLKDLLSYGYEIIVVDDGSETEQKKFIHDLSVYYLRHRINLGQGAALRTGMEYALRLHPTYVVSFDADGQHDPQDIPRMIGVLEEKNADIVFGSRFLPGSAHNLSFRRKMLLQTARFINLLFTGVLLTDAHNGLRVMNKKTVLLMHLEENRMAHATEIVTIVRRNHLHFEEAPVNIIYTSHSRNKGQQLPDAFRIFFDLLLNKIFG